MLDFVPILSSGLVLYLPILNLQKKIQTKRKKYYLPPFTSKYFRGSTSKCLKIEFQDFTPLTFYTTLYPSS